MKKYFLHYYIFFCFPVMMSYAGSEDSVMTKNDTIHKVMLIPYNPFYYLSDADQDIMEQTGREPRQVRENFRKTIDYNLKKAIQQRYSCLALLHDADSLPALSGDLEAIHSVTNFKYEKPVQLPGLQNSIAYGSKASKENPATDSKTAAQYVGVNADAEYMNAIIRKPGVLKEMYEKHNTDIFVFINQLDIKTNYNTCLDIANKIYLREVIVHFSIYNKEGIQLAGSSSRAFFPSDSNDANRIMRKCFPELARSVAMCLP